MNNGIGLSSLLMNIIWEFLTYQYLSKGRHGTHSPFVYEFVDKCLALPISKEHQSGFRSYYKSLIKNDTEIVVQDLGAGSKKMSAKRKIAQIAKISGSSGKYGRLLYKLTCYYKPKSILELGTSLGLGTWMLSKGNAQSKIITIEGCPNIYAFSKDKLASNSNVNCLNNDFNEYLKEIHPEKFDLVFIDGDHSGAKVLKMLANLDSMLHDESIVVLDDIRWSKDMLACWEQIISSNRYHLTMDLFRMGIIMKRAHQQKEHFIIKY